MVKYPKSYRVINNKKQINYLKQKLDLKKLVPQLQ